MRTFTALFITAALALTASAGVIEKRELSAPVKECTSLLSEASLQYFYLDSIFTLYSDDATTASAENSDAKPHVQKRQNQEASTAGTPANSDPAELDQRENDLLSGAFELQDIVDKAASKCCSLPADPTTAEDGEEVFTALDELAFTATGMLNTLKTKKASFKSGTLSYDIVQNFVVGLPENTHKVQGCLAGKVPEANKAGLKESQDELEKALNEVSATFDIPAGNSASSSPASAGPTGGNATEGSTTAA